MHDGPMDDGLKESLGPAEWSLLRPHHERGAVFLVATNLDLLTTARAIAKDDTSRVSGWLATGSLRRPGPTETTEWDRNPSRTFKSVIVQPYVLIQQIGN